MPNFSAAIKNFKNRNPEIRFPQYGLLNYSMRKQQPLLFINVIYLLRRSVRRVKTYPLRGEPVRPAKVDGQVSAGVAVDEVEPSVVVHISEMAVTRTIGWHDR